MTKNKLIKRLAAVVLAIVMTVAVFTFGGCWWRLNKLQEIESRLGVAFANDAEILHFTARQGFSGTINAVLQFELKPEDLLDDSRFSFIDSISGNLSISQINSRERLIEFFEVRNFWNIMPLCWDSDAFYFNYGHAGISVFMAYFVEQQVLVFFYVGDVRFNYPIFSTSTSNAYASTNDHATLEKI